MFTGYRRQFKPLVTSLTAALFLTTAAAQHLAPPGALKYVAGTVERVSDNQVYVNDGLQVLALAVDERTEIWKGTVIHNLSLLETGDEAMAQCRLDASGNLIAEWLRLNSFHSSAVVTSVTDTGFAVFTNPDADPQSGYTKEHKIVEVDAGTIFELSAREDLKPGRGVDVSGVVLKNGTVRATKVTVYEGNRPVRMAPGLVILPNGQSRLGN